MADAAETMRLTVEGITALYENGDPGVILNHAIQAPDNETALGIVSGLALMVAGAMHELDRVSGEGAGRAWLQREALKFQADG
jgi:hypothetical protein